MNALKPLLWSLNIAHTMGRLIGYSDYPPPPHAKHAHGGPLGLVAVVRVTVLLSQ